ncbi:MAG: phosphoglucosamine mutase [Alcanivorax borkumensis]|jgi:phosphoglucosamine mutase|uniref:Phosphoglucosamine mutase n=1 Tax=Alcanivorax borkumensis (strain ATCC 700651 / DSM 11573 / NCIMB 13689 / SK2) TaxID=393595 RepID=GLMM_ALCBS|nr:MULTISPECIES: phosphoglucosamine mutase [Alcanivorax]Q0VSS6.1 RecName: Full=Phosphoglucosamine mutase [Alcanivorax borkumensis SK2]OJH08644.1 MAG: phosphoglucosamine mutase [Alcanivorax borkumensis]BAP13186.1 phosphoglucosamine mutase [Alcanivorax sp. NBRC 101098]CAL15772.1 phosphoglucosamine mutase [Alcanivorax borkumensis SK2]
MTRKYFGTDGVRGTVGEFPITPDFVLKLGWAAGKVLGARGGSKILIGKDTRISGYMFESALEAGISAAGVDVRLLGPLPTPGIAYLTRTLSAQAGIVISASHNPYTDNGIKFFGADGRKLNDEIELEIERLLDEQMSVVSTDQIGKVRRIDDARGRYIEFCKSTAPGLDLNGMKIVVDTANGAAYHIAPDVFEELGATVVPLANQPDGFNINRDCGSTHPEALQRKVVEEKADLGVALDGDADRLLMVDHAGNLVDGDQLLFVVARDRKENGAEMDGVVGTLMSNFGLELALQAEGIEFVRAKVGDRYVMEQLDKRGWNIGGESSGHLVCLDCTTTGDGTVSALQVLAALSRRKQGLAESVADVSMLPQKMINVRGPNRDGFMENGDVQAAMADVEDRLAGNGRILLRPSGTEPLVRVMIEGKDVDRVESLCRELAEVVEKAIN